MTTYVVPLAQGAQQFQLLVGANLYKVRLIFLDNINPCWSMDISDNDDVPLVCGVPLVPGEDLLQPYGYLGFGFQMCVQESTDHMAVPNYAQLGTSTALFVIY